MSRYSSVKTLRREKHSRLLKILREKLVMTSRIMGIHDVTVKFPWRRARHIYNCSCKHGTIDPSKQTNEIPAILFAVWQKSQCYTWRICFQRPAKELGGICVICTKPLFGIQFKCQQCPWLAICKECQSRGIHSRHAQTPRNTDKTCAELAAMSPEQLAGLWPDGNYDFRILWYIWYVVFLCLIFLLFYCLNI